MELLRWIVSHGHGLRIISTVTFLVEWLVARMIALRARNHHALVDVQTAQIDIAVTITIEHRAVDGRVAERCRPHVDARLGMVIILGGTVVWMHQSLGRRAIRQQWTRHPVSAAAVQHHGRHGARLLSVSADLGDVLLALQRRAEGSEEVRLIEVGRSDQHRVGAGHHCHESTLAEVDTLVHATRAHLRVLTTGCIEVTQSDGAMRGMGVAALDPHIAVPSTHARLKLLIRGVHVVSCQTRHAKADGAMAGDADVQTDVDVAKLARRHPQLERVEHPFLANGHRRVVRQSLQRECASAHLGSLARPAALGEELFDVLGRDVSVLPTAGLDRCQHARQRRVSKHDVLAAKQRHALEQMRVLRAKTSRGRLTIAKHEQRARILVHEQRVTLRVQRSNQQKSRAIALERSRLRRDELHRASLQQLQVLSDAQRVGHRSDLEPAKQRRVHEQVHRLPVRPRRSHDTLRAVRHLLKSVAMVLALGRLRVDEWHGQLGRVLHDAQRHVADTIGRKALVQIQIRASGLETVG